MEPRLVELEQDPANWRELADRNALANLSKKETKRQEVINGREREDVQIKCTNAKYIAVIY
jgi:hypothetical protein